MSGSNTAHPLQLLDEDIPDAPRRGRQGRPMERATCVPTSSALRDKLRPRTGAAHHAKHFRLELSTTRLHLDGARRCPPFEANRSRFLARGSAWRPAALPRRPPASRHCRCMDTEVPAIDHSVPTPGDGPLLSIAQATRGLDGRDSRMPQVPICGPSARHVVSSRL